MGEGELSKGNGGLVSKEACADNHRHVKSVRVGIAHTHHSEEAERLRGFLNDQERENMDRKKEILLCLWEGELD